MQVGAAVLLEGAQGSLLDVDHGTYPFVTSSNTTSGGAAIGVGHRADAIDAVLGVVKAYTTRVGAGPLPTEMDEPLQSEVRTLGNEFGATTGRARRCGWFDAVVVRYATRVNGLTDLAVTKLDVLDTLDRIGDLHRLRDRRRAARRSFPGDLTLLEQRDAALRVVRGLAALDGRRAPLDDLPARGARVPRPDRGAGRDADHVRERRDAPRSDHRAVRIGEATRAARRRSADRRRAGRAGSPRRSRRSAPGLRARVLDAGAVVSTIAHYPTYVRFFSTAEKLVARRSAVRRRDGEADAARRARVLSRRRAALRDSTCGSTSA